MIWSGAGRCTVGHNAFAVLLPRPEERWIDCLSIPLCGLGGYSSSPVWGQYSQLSNAQTLRESPGHVLVNFFLEPFPWISRFSKADTLTVCLFCYGSSLIVRSTDIPSILSRLDCQGTSGLLFASAWDSGHATPLKGMLFVIQDCW